MRLRPGSHFVLPGLILMCAIGCAREPQPGGAEGGPVEQPIGAKEERADRAFTTEKTPDGRWLAATFPGKPEWADVPDLAPPAKGFVWPGDGTRKPLAAWVWTVAPKEREERTDAELAVKYGRAAVRSGTVHTWQLPSGAWGAGFHSTFRDQCGNPVGTAPDDPFRTQYGTQNGLGVCVAQTIVVGSKVYAVRMTGQGHGYNDPDFVAFAASLRPPELTDRPAVGKSPADDLRPLAKIVAPKEWPGRYSMAFAPARSAVFETQLQDTVAHFNFTGRIARYHYPSFRPAGFYPFPDPTYELAAGDHRLFVAAGPARAAFPERDTRIVRLDIAPPRDGLNDAGLADPKEAKFAKRVEKLRVAPDGKFVYALHRETKWDNSNDVVRVETEGMTTTGTLKVADKTESLCLSPDGRTLFAASHASLYPWGSASDRRCQIQEIDTGTLRVRRTFAVRGYAGQLVCATDGRLYIPDGACMARIDPTGPGEPVVRYFDRGASEYGFFVSPVAKRVYVSTGMHQPYSLDAAEAFEYGRVVIAPNRYKNLIEMSLDFTKPGREPYSKYGVLSPDGKCLFLHSGHVYWLAGAGPLPDVDPAVKWNP